MESVTKELNQDAKLRIFPSKEDLRLRACTNLHDPKYYDDSAQDVTTICLNADNY